MDTAPTPNPSLTTGIASVPIERRIGTGRAEAVDQVAIEEPLELQLAYASPQGPRRRTLAITMRTPGHDAELAVGFLLTEGIIGSRDDLAEVGPQARRTCRNLVRIALRDHVAVDLQRLERHFYTTSSCGVCGKTSIAALRARSPFPPAPTGAPPRIPAALVHQLPERLRAGQEVFSATGGLHASALFTASGDLVLLREDVGRHNALDKVIGRALLDGLLPLREHLLLVSGRASFELVQKAAMAGLPFLGAVGAPSSLAVALAREAGMTLAGWVRDGRCNVYTGAWRIT